MGGGSWAKTRGIKIKGARRQDTRWCAALRGGGEQAGRGERKRRTRDLTKSKQYVACILSWRRWIGDELNETGVPPPTARFLIRTVEPATSPSQQNPSAHVVNAITAGRAEKQATPPPPPPDAEKRHGRATVKEGTATIVPVAHTRTQTKPRNHKKTRATYIMYPPNNHTNARPMNSVGFADSVPVVWHTAARKGYQGVYNRVSLERFIHWLDACIPLTFCREKLSKMLTVLVAAAATTSASGAPDRERGTGAPSAAPRWVAAGAPCRGKRR